MTAIGCLASPTYYSGQDISAIGKKHQHNVAQALFAGFRSRNELPPVLRPFVGSNSEGNHFCLCRPGDVCASEELCSNAARLTVTVRVQWHRQVSCTRAALWHCGVLCCEESTSDSWDRSQAAVSATLCSMNRCLPDGCTVCRWKTCLQPDQCGLPCTATDRSGLRCALFAGVRSLKRNACDRISSQVSAHILH